MAETLIALRHLKLNGVGAFGKGDVVPADNAGVIGTFDGDTRLTDPQWEEGVDYAAADTPEAEVALTGPQRPANSASKAAWVDYAVALLDEGNPLGLARADAEERSRDQIIEHIDGQAG